MLKNAFNLINEIYGSRQCLVAVACIRRLMCHTIGRSVDSQNQIRIFARIYREGTCRIDMLLGTNGHSIILVGRHCFTAHAGSIGYIYQRQLILQTVGSTAQKQQAKLICAGEETDFLLRQLIYQNIHLACFPMCLRIGSGIVTPDKHIIKIAAFHTMQQKLCGADIVVAACKHISQYFPGNAAAQFRQLLDLFTLNLLKLQLVLQLSQTENLRAPFLIICRLCRRTAGLRRTHNSSKYINLLSAVLLFQLYQAFGTLLQKLRRNFMCARCYQPAIKQSIGRSNNGYRFTSLSLQPVKKLFRLPCRLSTGNIFGRRQLYIPACSLHRLHCVIKAHRSVVHGYI